MMAAKPASPPPTGRETSPTRPTPPPPPPAEAPAPKPAPTSPRAPASAPAATPPADDHALWERVLELGQGRAATAAFLDGLDILRCEDDRASILVREPRQLSFAEGRRGALEELFERAAGRRIRVEYVVDRDTDDGDDRAPLDHAARAAAEAHPVVSRAIDLFDARVVDVDGDAPGRT